MAGVQVSKWRKNWRDRFNSTPLERRFIRTMETLTQEPEKPIRLWSQNRAEAKDESRNHGNLKIGLLEDKESFRWALTLEKSRVGLPRDEGNHRTGKTKACHVRTSAHFDYEDTHRGFNEWIEWFNEVRFPRALYYGASVHRAGFKSRLKRKLRFRWNLALEKAV